MYYYRTSLTVYVPVLQDALIDVAVSLGAPLSKLILTAPAFANSFNLVDPERNLPGSAVTGLPTTLTYQQVGGRDPYSQPGGYKEMSSTFGWPIASPRI
jgi:hypothetical protein